MRYLKLTSELLLWAFVLFLSLYFFIDPVLVYLYGYRSRIFGDSLMHNQVWVVGHLVGGTVALLLGPVQFWKGVRTRYPAFHRGSGKAYIAGTFLAGVSALRLSLLSFCEPCRVSLFILAVLVLATTAAAWYAIRWRNIKAHRQFMVRSYVLILSFVAVRIDGLYSLAFLFGTIEDPTFNRVANEDFFSFVPLLVTEIFLTWVPALRGGRSGAARPSPIKPV